MITRASGTSSSVVDLAVGDAVVVYSQLSHADRSLLAVGGDGGLLCAVQYLRLSHP